MNAVARLSLRLGPEPKPEYRAPETIPSESSKKDSVDAAVTLRLVLGSGNAARAEQYLHIANEIFRQADIRVVSSKYYLPEESEFAEFRWRERSKFASAPFVSLDPTVINVYFVQSINRKPNIRGDSVLHRRRPTRYRLHDRCFGFCGARHVGP